MLPPALSSEQDAKLRGPLGKEATMGTVAVGKVADLVVLDADPLADIANTTKIRAVIARGRLLDREALDKMLKAAEVPGAVKK